MAASNHPRRQAPAAGRLGGAAAAAALLLSLQLLLLPPAAGHGIMIQPRSRNWMAYLQEGYNYAHGLSAGGANKVSDYGKRRYPNGRRGYCGDPYDKTKWDAPRSPVITYSPGQIINVDILVAVNHMGRMGMTVCPLDAKPGQGRCRGLYLQGDGVKGGVKSWYFPGIDKWTGGNWGGDGPRYGDGTFTAYKLPSIPRSAGWGCNSQELCNAFKDMWVYRTRWQLPKDFKCDHCKLQWHWVTGHSCWPPCEKGNPFAQCQNKQVFPTCGKDGAAYPEEFLNCADVTIKDNARIDSATNYPPWNWQVDLKSGKWGEVRPSLMNRD